MTKLTPFSSLAQFFKNFKRKKSTPEINEHVNSNKNEAKDVKMSPNSLNNPQLSDISAPRTGSNENKYATSESSPNIQYANRDINPKNKSWNKTWNDINRDRKKDVQPEKEIKKSMVPTPRIDKKGFRVLTERHDLNQLFTGELTGSGNYPEIGNNGYRSNLKPTKHPEEDFETLFKLYQVDRRHNMLMDEKKKGVSSPAPLTMNERLKAYPGPQSEIDLHGHTAAEAESQTDAFIWNARYRGLKTVRIIVGKGLHSENKAVLPDVVETKLIRLKQERYVLDYKWENKDKRKSGALIVYLIPLF